MHYFSSLRVAKGDKKCLSLSLCAYILLSIKGRAKIERLWFFEKTGKQATFTWILLLKIFDSNICKSLFEVFASKSSSIYIVENTDNSVVVV